VPDLQSVGQQTCSDYLLSIPNGNKMEILSLDEIVKVICGQIISGDRAAKIKGISTDSRTI